MIELTQSKKYFLTTTVRTNNTIKTLLNTQTVKKNQKQGLEAQSLPLNTLYDF